MWARSHEGLASTSCMVSSGGRVFYIVDEGPRYSVALDSEWFLVARDAFNGVLLWKKRMGPWEGQLRDFRNKPPELPRRMVAIDDRLYVTLGYGEPVSALDAATGERLFAFEGTTNAVEILCSGGIILITGGSYEDERLKSSLFKSRLQRQAIPPPENRWVKVFNAGSGKLLWAMHNEDTMDLAFTSAAIRNGRVFLHNSKGLLCIDAQTGTVNWRVKTDSSESKRPETPILVVLEEVVLCAGSGKLDAYSVKDGRLLWNAPHHDRDVLFAQGAIWTGELTIPANKKTGEKQNGLTQARDPLSGKVIKERPSDFEFYEVTKGHHYCYRNKGTADYLLTGRQGVEFIDLETGKATPNSWIRGGCSYGVLPANGILYLPPNPCSCHSEVMLHGFCALSGSKNPEPIRPLPVAERLFKGPAYATLKAELEKKMPGPGWPAFRGDNGRTGSLSAEIAPQLSSRWKADFGGPSSPDGDAAASKLSSITVAGDKVYVCAVDQHTLFAINRNDGTIAWSFVAGSRIDSPPAIVGGALFFGSNDGFVYCLRAEDGEMAWKFQAAPRIRSVISYNQVESAWPVHGSVLVEDGSIYVAAGRNTHLDGGIFLYKLDCVTGRVVAENTIDASSPASGRTAKAKDGVAEGRAQIMSSDSTNLFMGDIMLDKDLAVASGKKNRIFPGYGFLDDSWFHRSCWSYGSKVGGTFGGWVRATYGQPTGHILVKDEKYVYGYGRDVYSTDGSHIGAIGDKNKHFQLFASPADSKATVQKRTKDGQKALTYDQSVVETIWTAKPVVKARAMALVANILLIAGPPNYEALTKWSGFYDAAAYQKWLQNETAAYRGEQGGRLLAISRNDGKPLSEYSLEAQPVFDGLAAANGQVFVALENGTVACYGTAK